MPEQRFGKYTLYERIAVGGMAEVFRAKTSEGEEIALKRIHPHHLENEDFVAMLIDEAKISIQLQHPNIIQVRDLGRVDRHYFIAMEFIAGRDLRRVMERLSETGRSLPVVAAASIIARVARGLDFAHAAVDAKGMKLEIIHRDISPQNVLVGFDGNVKVIDFGIAKAAGRLMETQVGILKGKYAYMSPEQATGQPLDQRTDIFSTGILLYECAVGKHPFRAAHDFETLRNIKQGTMLAPREANPSLPASLEKVILTALATRKEERYFTAGMMARELESAVDGLSPGYGEADLSELVQGLFSDELVEGAVVKEINRTEVGTPQRPAVRLGPGPTSSTSLNASQLPTVTAQAVAHPLPPFRPLARDRTSTAREAQSPGPGPLEALRGFWDRLEEGRLSPGDNAAMIVFALLVFGLALWLLLQPGPSAWPLRASSTAAAVSLADLAVDSDPSDAVVSVGGKVRGKTPLRLTGLPSGQALSVTLSHPGYADWTGPAVPGRQLRLFASLRSLPVSIVNVAAMPRAQVLVDEHVVGMTPQRLELAPGKVTIRVRDPLSGAEASRTIEVKAGAPPQSVSFRLQ